MFQLKKVPFYPFSRNVTANANILHLGKNAIQFKTKGIDDFISMKNR